MSFYWNKLGKFSTVMTSLLICMAQGILLTEHLSNNCADL